MITDHACSSKNKLNNKRALICNGRTKIIYEGSQPNSYVIYFKDALDKKNMCNDPAQLLPSELKSNLNELSDLLAPIKTSELVDEVAVEISGVGVPNVSIKKLASANKNNAQSLDSANNLSENFGSIKAAAVLNNRLNAIFMERLQAIGIETHFIKINNMREQLVKAVDPLPFRLQIHNIVTVDFAERYDLEVGQILADPIIELYVRNSSGDDWAIAAQHLFSLNWSHEAELETLFILANRVNDFMLGNFSALNLTLATYSLEFGKIYGEFFESIKWLVIDLIGLDSSVIIDNQSNERLDSKDAAEVNWQGYQKLSEKLGISNLDAVSPFEVR